MIGNPYSIHRQPWPTYDESLTHADEVTLIVQVDGKLRDRLMVAAGLGEEAAREAALSSEKIQTALNGSEPARVIYVPRPPAQFGYPLITLSGVCCVR